jgi:hypothetical protein
MTPDRLAAALAELRPEDKLAATIHHWHEPTKTKGDKTPCAAAYAISIMINRRVRFIMYGIGYANEPIPLTVFGIDSLLKLISPGRWIEVSALANLWQYTKPGGIGHYAMEHGGLTKSGGELSSYPVIGNLLEASAPPPRWSLSLQPPVRNAPGYAEAAAYVRGKAKTAALKHKADFVPTGDTDPKPIIIQEFVDAYPE